MSTTTARPRATKKYRALIAAGLSDLDALTTMGVVERFAVDLPNEPVVDDRVATLVAGGFTPEQAEQIVADQGEAKPKKAKKAKKAKAAKSEPVLSAKERAEALVAEKALTFTRGRVYVTPSVIEAQARVMKTGSPEVVQTSGVGHVSAVLIYREESGDVAIQNLKKPA